jgi:hypothetical protein
MPPSLSQQSLPTPLLLTEGRAKTAKASIRKPEGDEFYARIGQCIDEVRNVFGLTLQEFAAVLGKDERQVKRQIEGKERPQIEAVFAVERFQGPLVIALARLAAGCEIDTVVHFKQKRSA